MAIARMIGKSCPYSARFPVKIAIDRRPMGVTDSARVLLAVTYAPIVDVLRVYRNVGWNGPRGALVKYTI